MHLLAFSKDFFNSFFLLQSCNYHHHSFSPLCTLLPASQQRDLKPRKCDLTITNRSLMGRCAGLGGTGRPTAWGWVTLTFPWESRSYTVPSVVWAMLRECMEIIWSGTKTEEEETPFMNIACSLLKRWAQQFAVKPLLPACALLCVHSLVLWRNHRTPGWKCP